MLGSAYQGFHILKYIEEAEYFLGSMNEIFVFLQVSLTNVVMELRKLCGHPYLLEGVEPNVRNQTEANR